MANRKCVRAAQGAGTIRKKTVMRKGQSYTYWEARVTTGRDPGTGKQVQKSFTGKTQKEVREKMQAAAVEVNNSSYLEPSKLTLAQWLDIWLDSLYSQKPGTIRHYRAQIEAHIKPKIGALKLADLQKSDFDRFYKYLLTSGKETKKKDPSSGKMVVVARAPLSQKSVKNIHVILKAAIGAAIDEGKLQTDPMRKVEFKTPPKPEIHPLDDEQVKAYLAAVEADPLALMLKFILFTGLREGEAMGLTWDCVNFRTGQITIRQQLQDLGKANGGMTIVPTKNSKVRVLTPAPSVLYLLKQQQAKQLEDRFRAGDTWTGWQTEDARKKALVFTNAFGGCFRPKTVYQHNRKIAAAAGIDSCRVHDLRHTFAVLSLQNGDDVKTVQSNLGHATAAFTLDVYGHVTDRMKSESAARMEAYIKSIGGG